MRILVTGGGTGGHINPAIAVAQYFRSQSPDNQILYAGTPEGMEARLVAKAGFDFAPIRVQGFTRSFLPQDILYNVKSAWLAVTSRSRARKILREFRPDVVLGTGGYVCGPVVLEASRMGIRTAIHESNAYPGVTNRLLARHVDLVFLAVEEARKRLPEGIRYEVVGNPIRESIIYQSREAARNALGLDERMCLLSVGGSLGADTINKMAADVMAWHWKQGLIQHIHGYGKNGRTKFPALLREKGIDLNGNSSIRVSEYIDNMDVCMAAADLLICRAGAITVSEIEATGKPAILVPSPNVAENHQYHNAMVLVNRGAACILEEKDYTPERIVGLVKDLYEHPDKRQALSENASRLAILDTASRIGESLAKLISQ